MVDLLGKDSDNRYRKEWKLSEIWGYTTDPLIYTTEDFDSQGKLKTIFQNGRL